MAKKRRKSTKKPVAADNASLSNPATKKAYAHASVQEASNTYVLLQNDRGAFLSVSLIEETLAVEFRVKDRIVASAVLGTSSSCVTVNNEKNYPCLDLEYDAKANVCTLIRRDDRGEVSKTML